MVFINVFIILEIFYPCLKLHSTHSTLPMAAFLVTKDRVNWSVSGSGLLPQKSETQYPHSQRLISKVVEGRLLVNQKLFLSHISPSLRKMAKPQQHHKVPQLSCIQTYSCHWASWACPRKVTRFCPPSLHAAPQRTAPHLHILRHPAPQSIGSKPSLTMVESVLCHFCRPPVLFVKDILWFYFIFRIPQFVLLLWWEAYIQYEALQDTLRPFKTRVLHFACFDLCPRMFLSRTFPEPLAPKTVLGGSINRTWWPREFAPKLRIDQGLPSWRVSLEYGEK